MSSTRLTTLVAALLLVCANAIPTITTKGSKFFTSDGDQFFLKGIAYQLAESDPLLDAEQCKADAKLMSTLGANAIRVYHVEDGDHTGCMNAFADNGIYLFVDLDTFDTQMDQNSTHWNQTQEDRFRKVMDEFHTFDNTAGFFIGNEVITDGEHSEAAVYVKAATRDLKSYRDSKNYRKIPVGYSHADISSLRPNLQNFLTCGDTAEDNIDFFGLNAYEWCGQSSFMLSGYSALNDQVMDFPVPIFFSETGCNTVPPRNFQDQTAIFGPQMAPYWSGAIIYEWVQESNHYGLITYGTITNAAVSIPATAEVTRSGTPRPVSPDFQNLKSVWSAVSPSSVKSAGYNPQVTPPPCPAFTAGVWEINGNVNLPTVGATLDQAAQTSLNSGGGVQPTATADNKKGSAVSGRVGGAGGGGRVVLGMCVGLVTVMVGFVWWL